MDLLWDRGLTGIEPYENPQLHGAAVRAMARGVWRVEGFLENFAQRHRGFVSRTLHIVERGVLATLRKAAGAVDPHSDVQLYGGHVRGFQANCELMLGLLALRGTAMGELLAVGTPRMLRLAKEMRRADCLITKAGKTVGSMLGLQVPAEEKEGLERVSDLVFVLNSYLTGAAGLNTIRIESLSDGE